MSRGEKTCNGGEWTDARLHAFIMGALRNAHTRWGPACRAKKRANIKRGLYLCSACREAVPSTIPAVYIGGKKAGKPYRKKNAVIDHIIPVVDPVVGFTTWDEAIQRMFVEEAGYQILCDSCHQEKCNEERAIRKANKAN
jgi:hypothetical protein